MTKSLLQLILLKGKGRRKEKVARRARLIQMTFVITAKNLIIGRNILLLSLSRMIPNMKMIWVMIPIKMRKIMNEDEIIAQSQSQLFGPKIADMGASVALGLNHIC